MNYLLTLAHGAPCFRQEAAYALLSFRRQHGDDAGGCRVLVATDVPDDFTRVLGHPHWLQFLPLNATQLQDWRGTDGYVHRVKPMAILHAARTVQAGAGDALLFLDSDTCVQSSLLPLFAQIGAGRVLLHQREGTLRGSRRHSRSQGRLWRASRRRALPVCGREQVLAPDLKLWNSGVVGLRGDQLHLLDDTLALIDVLRSTLAIATAEQVALSAVLAERGIEALPADSGVLHYHTFKEFRTDLAAFFAQHAGATPSQWLQHMAEVDPAVRTQPKLAFNRLPKWWRQLRKAAGRPWQALPYPWQA